MPREEERARKGDPSIFFRCGCFILLVFLFSGADLLASRPASPLAIERKRKEGNREIIKQWRESCSCSLVVVVAAAAFAA